MSGFRGRLRRGLPREGGTDLHHHHYDAAFVDRRAGGEIREWIGSLHPLWEHRFPTSKPLPPGVQQRRLLRPVYWLGSWQFACLDYYRPPRHVRERCVVAEPFPQVLRRLIAQIEGRARAMFRGSALPPGWALNTCLVNFYGDRWEQGRWVDAARVGEHRDFEPGPVASLSFGERALIQFVERRGRGQKAAVVLEQWLDDGSLQLFGGPRWKDETLHRVQRVDRRSAEAIGPTVEGFRIRRVNLTFRYVPPQHVHRWSGLRPAVKEEIRPYMAELAKTSPFFAAELVCEAGTKGAVDEGSGSSLG